MGPNNSPALTPMRIFQTLRAVQDTAALNSGIELGVFTSIAEGASTAAEIAARCNASERGVRILCDTLVSNEYLTKHFSGDDAPRYANTPDAALFLDSRSPAYMGSVAEFLCGPGISSEILHSLTACVRNGGTVASGEGTVNPDNPMWVTFARAMAPLAMMGARAIAQLVPAEGALKVLDIAAGHGVFGIEVARRNPQARITAVDWAAVLEVARENAEKAGVADRIEMLPGSAFDVDLGSGYDLVLLSNFLHHFDVPANESLLRRFHAALRPGGSVITLEFVPDENRVSPPIPARFALTMLSGTRGGDAYTFADLDSMFRNAGFPHSVQHMMESQQSIIISTK